MNSTQVLLLGLIIYFAITEKSKDTRNVLLIVAGLLFFCIMNVKEGFVIASESDLSTIFSGAGAPARPARSAKLTADGTQTVGKFTFTGAGPFDLNPDHALPNATATSARGVPEGLTCTLDSGDQGIVSYNDTDFTTAPSPSPIGTYLTCSAPPQTSMWDDWPILKSMLDDYPILTGVAGIGLVVIIIGSLSVALSSDSPGSQKRTESDTDIISRMAAYHLPSAVAKVREQPAALGA